MSGGIYAGIGARKTPDKILSLMKALGYNLAKQGYTLNSGGAIGADSAFEAGCDLIQGPKNIFLAKDATDAARQEIKRYLEPHHYEVLVRKGYLDLHARNCFQVLGRDLKTPVRFVICWTPDGATTAIECSKTTGGTASAIKVATAYNIPVLNLQREDHLKKALSWFE